MSSTIGSPAAITRSEASWCGDDEFGPEPTIAKSAVSWPSATRRSRTSRATSASVRPTSRPAAIASTTRSAASAASRSSAISSASLTIRSSRSTAVADPKPRRQHLLEPEQMAGPERVADATSCPRALARGRDVADEVRHEAVGGLGLVPRAQVDEAADERRGAAGRLRLEARHDEGDRLSGTAGMTSIVRRSSGIAA